MNTKNQYIPGVCNIGEAEAANRKRFFYLGTLITVVVWVLFLLLKAPAGVYIILFLPASLAATGYIQAKQHFCAGFGMRGLFNFGDEIGKTDTAAQAEFRAQDRKQAIRITMMSLVIGLLVAIVAIIVSVVSK